MHLHGYKYIPQWKTSFEASRTKIFTLLRKLCTFLAMMYQVQTDHITPPKATQRILTVLNVKI